MNPSFDPASFRDPAGSVIVQDGRVLRLLRRSGAAIYRELSARGIYDKLAADGVIVPGVPVDVASIPVSADEILLEHQPIEIISYPFEWPFDLLKKAALFHLDLQLRLLDDNVTLIDASAYNVQFVGTKPVFIDLLSLRPYNQDEPWLAQRQFVEHFLAPLVLQAKRGVPFHDMYASRIEGIDIEDVASVLRARNCLSPTVLAFISAPAALQRRHRKVQKSTSEKLHNRKLPLKNFRAILLQLRAYIEGLSIGTREASVWGTYEQENTYSTDETRRKAAFVAAFVRDLKTPLILDLGCNAGFFSEVALREGARSVIGLDADHGALASAVRRANASELPFLPMYQNLLRPSPAQGWRLAERQAIFPRLSKADALLALALIHHIVIGGNVPLASAIDQLVAMAPRGVIEFVPKNDETVKIMLAARVDIFDDYDVDTFRSVLGQKARISREEVVSTSGRTLFAYDRT